MYKGIWNKNVPNLWTGKGTYPTYEAKDPENKNPQFPEDFIHCVAEGYVVRLSESFKYEDHVNSTSKFVRKNHIKTSENWMQRMVISNLLQ